MPRCRAADAGLRSRQSSARGPQEGPQGGPKRVPLPGPARWFPLCRFSCEAAAILGRNTALHRPLARWHHSACMWGWVGCKVNRGLLRASRGCLRRSASSTCGRHRRCLCPRTHGATRNYDQPCPVADMRILMAVTSLMSMATRFALTDFPRTSPSSSPPPPPPPRRTASRRLE